MNERATAEATAALGIVSNFNQAARRRPRLCLTWALDPTTGKPASRWVVENPGLSH